MIDLAALKFILIDSVELLKLIAIVGGPIALLAIVAVWGVARRRKAG